MDFDKNWIVKFFLTLSGKLAFSAVLKIFLSSAYPTFFFKNMSHCKLIELLDYLDLCFPSSLESCQPLCSQIFIACLSSSGMPIAYYSAW